MTFSSRAYRPRTRGNVPYDRGCGFPDESGPYGAFARESLPMAIYSFAMT